MRIRLKQEIKSWRIKQVREDMKKKDQRMFINLGNDYKLNDKTRFSFEFEKTFFGDLNVDWSVNANLRYSF
ncbi:autotransporter outer membrane beta-barrel domain-containing protein [Campylobacter jejuni]|uniref:autotransporter outer membrane beta-barrel domain-containing protein n=1 Tax=Campylobacter jejuni TaxID=197 RepID=UPI000F9D2B47|nr:autotransporter outer membrane beta-barrel domain-containing protein [Campylobacter jejuni]EAB5243431.1 autotransporter outer membrane beta-barrel domain-containing protein [Campylobacter jejuni]EAH5766728.1 autotransporter outer membrane beta-barrel domain-containing protein [Campylobacter jejuni]EAH7047969.1 autotransporter outer membrane beta-barrel domain-containing protein [Campylobacter jejuni]EAH7377439.1 autotransporter outer membrane beta-barrel domain-containing protein [Campylobac